MKWIAHPFLRITPLLIMGILVNSSFRCPVTYLSFLLSISALIFSLNLVFSLGFKKYDLRRVQGVVGMLSFVLLGYLSAQFYHQIHKPSITTDSLSNTTFYTATINSKPASTAKTTKYKVEIKQLKNKHEWVSVNQEAILYLKNDAMYDFDYGDMLLIKGRPEYMEGQKNPYAFDYSLYLQRRGIYFQDFISKEDFIMIHERHTASLSYLSLYIGDYFEGILSKYILSERELNMIKAMILGRRDDITPEMEYVYASSGTAHVLAVSGLHVGIIYLIFSSVFKFLKLRKLNIIYYGINLCAIWSFAWITGMSPSVQRASIMLSFIIIAELSKRKSSIYNTVLASAFFILLFAPNLLFSVSFQLSYAAVFGIVYAYKKIYLLIYIKQPVVNFFWKMTVISLAAQIATFPVSIYYFKQFPVLFPITNLLAIPTASLLIIGGFLLIISSPLPFFATIIGYLIEKWIWMYNEILVFASSIPFALIENLYLKPTYVFLIICCVMLLLQFMFTRKFYFFLYLSFLFFILSGSVIIDRALKSRQREIIFYHVNNKRHIDIYWGRNCFTNIKSNSVEIVKEVGYHITPSRNYHLIENVYALGELGIVKEFGANTLIHSNNTTILILNDLQSLTKNTTGIPVEYLIIGKEMISDLTEIKKMFKIRNLILDATVSSWYIEKVREKMTGSLCTIYAIKTEGALRINI